MNGLRKKSSSSLRVFAKKDHKYFKNRNLTLQNARIKLKKISGIKIARKNRNEKGIFLWQFGLIYGQFRRCGRSAEGGSDLEKDVSRNLSSSQCRLGNGDRQGDGEPSIAANNRRREAERSGATFCLQV